MNPGRFPVPVFSVYLPVSRVWVANWLQSVVVPDVGNDP